MCQGLRESARGSGALPPRDGVRLDPSPEQTHRIKVCVSHPEVSRPGRVGRMPIPDRSGGRPIGTHPMRHGLGWSTPRPPERHPLETRRKDDSPSPPDRSERPRAHTNFNPASEASGRGAKSIAPSLSSSRERPNGASGRAKRAVESPEVARGWANAGVPDRVFFYD